MIEEIEMNDGRRIEFLLALEKSTICPSDPEMEFMGEVSGQSTFDRKQRDRKSFE